jgi:hypothetical protein
LAADFSYENSSEGGSPYIPNMQATINPARAAELDRMVEAGDWRAVLNAANRYDGEETTGNQYLPMGLRSTQSCTWNNLEDDTGSRASIACSKVSLVSVVESVHTMLGYTSCERSVASGSKGSVPASTDQRMKEIQREIEVLVVDVLPEEIDSVGELMTHFEGKEEELLYTLQTMKSRFANQRARLARQPPPSMVTASRPIVALAVPVTPALPVPTPPSSALGPSNDDTDLSHISGDDEFDVVSEFDFERALVESSAAAAATRPYHY